jgi:enoyl-CoA hydratase/carnithine racemase
VATLTFDRAHALNSMSPDLLEELTRALTRIEQDASVRACVVTGQGRAFSAGGDLKVLESLAARDDGAARVTGYMETVATTLRALEALRVPTIAAVNGMALAGGLEIALCCDIVIAAEEAEFGDVHARFGLLPGGGGSARLPRRIGLNPAKYLMLTGRTVSARQMMDWGLVSEVVPAEQLSARAQELARTIAGHSPLGMTRMKQLVDDGMQCGLDDALRAERAMVATHSQSHDFNEGLAAFTQRRRPKFLGR